MGACLVSVFVTFWPRSTLVFLRHNGLLMQTGKNDLHLNLSWHVRGHYTQNEFCAQFPYCTFKQITTCIFFFSLRCCNVLIWLQFYYVLNVRFKRLFLISCRSSNASSLSKKISRRQCFNSWSRPRYWWSYPQTVLTAIVVTWSASRPSKPVEMRALMGTEIPPSQLIILHHRLRQLCCSSWYL
jgi:hypothetical protein